MNPLPDATPNPCNDCPWARTATGGWLGPFTAEEWLQIVHSDQPIACHLTIPSGGGEWEHPDIRQCRGAAIFRENRCKSPRNPEVITGPLDTDRVFATDDEFREHHDTDLARYLAASMGADR